MGIGEWRKEGRKEGKKEGGGGKGKEEGEEANKQNTGFLGPWKYSYSVWYCNGKYMSLYISPNPSNVQHQE